MKKNQLLFIQDFPKPQDLGEERVLIYDQVLIKKSLSFKKWQSQFDKKYAVTAGESLKAVEHFPKHISKIIDLCQNTSSRKLTLVVVGGGSVGDFGGFVASILKRGVGLMHIPSTWLSALDSAHGGKTALNVGKAKNQIGTFYPAGKTILVKSLLMSQPESRAFEGFGELLKIAWLQGGTLWKDLSSEKEVDGNMLWRYLPRAIDGKLKIVAQDPEEKSGLRHILNFGHTVGHILESYHQLPHGIAINYGMDFALKWSLERKIMSPAEFEKIQSTAIAVYLLSPVRDELFSAKAPVLKDFRQLLLSDKKKTSSTKVRFVFLKSPGKPVIQEVSVDDILVEICRQFEEDTYE
ncbi:hypothetical protein AZI86_04370 [Bdellovibrio bacteriovorus]|uniref:Uncharacterized protein n=1 Tax=Bdellovibrio bacteriovorus TaxID=959 RepID=A0A150WPR5_BDEBC|nr:hypothetical protein [Bdellovibrio bacteriovorus]KYG66297.1 hypothetical protein AZI86_04370 [Bdellovibrio bacteriovorus]